MNDTTDPPEPSKALAISRETTLDSFRRGLEPRDLEAVYKFATVLAKTKLNGIVDEEDAVVRIVTGRELGLTMMQSAMAVFAFDGKGSQGRKLGIYAEVLEALCLQSGEFERWDWIKRDNDGCTLVAKRLRRAEVTVSFGKEDAERAGLLNRGKDEEAKKANAYQAHPRRMYTARCRSEMAGLLGADIIRGFKSYEEMADANAIVVEAVEPSTTGADRTRETANAMQSLVDGLVTRLRDPGRTPQAFRQIREDIVSARKDGRLTGAYLAEVELAYNETHPDAAKEHGKAEGAPKGGK